jgi:hypothetical protein
LLVDESAYGGYFFILLLAQITFPKAKNFRASSYKNTSQNTLTRTNKQIPLSQLIFPPKFANIAIKEVEMKKRIPCKIISSVPIDSKETSIQPINATCEYPHRSDELHAANFWNKQTHRVSNSNAFGICMGILNAIPAGQILDYLA